MLSFRKETWVNYEDWVQQTRTLLRLEREEELQALDSVLSSLSSKACQDKGISLLSLTVRDTRTRLFGRTSYSVGKMSGSALPAHSFKVGDEVRLHSVAHEARASKDKDGTGESGVVGSVSKVSADSVEITSREVMDDMGGDVLVPPLRLDMRPNDATHRKLMKGLDTLQNIDHTPAWLIKEWLFHTREVPDPPKPRVLPFVYNSGLNSGQLEAVAHCLDSKLSLVHGPPGTGKTTTVVELVRQAVSRGERVLVVAPSNVAVDNVMEPLLSPPKHTPKDNGAQGLLRVPNVVRIGHPSRISENVLVASLEARINRHDGTDIVKDVRAAMDLARGRAAATRDKSKRREYRQEAKDLVKELRLRETKVVKEIIASANVVCATCVGASSHLLTDLFDRVIIDEAAQTTEVACWIAMQMGKSVTLAGDHCQLPPTIKSQAAADGGLDITLFQRIMHSERSPKLSTVAKLLDTQYRMNADIGDWASIAMYDGQLRAHLSVAGHTLRELLPASDPEDELYPGPVLLVVDTAGCDMDEDTPSDGGSKRNQWEARLVLTHVAALVDGGMPQEKIGVITPYNGQLSLLKDMCRERFPAVQTKTVDGFQGGEKDAIILSLVRSNAKGHVGFLADSRRINVAVTRARRQLVVVCDSGTVEKDAFIASLLAHMEERGDYRSAAEYSHVWDAEDAAGLAPANVARGGSQKKAGAGGSEGQRGLKMKELKGPRTTGASVPVPRGGARGQGGGTQRAERTTTAKAALRGGKGPGPGAVSEKEVMVEKPDKPDPELETALAEVDEVARSGGRVELSPSLNTFQRMRVHERAEETGVQHQSTGEGPARRIAVWRATRTAVEHTTPRPRGAVGVGRADTEALVSSQRRFNEDEEEEEEEGSGGVPAAVEVPGAAKKKKKKKSKKKGKGGGGSAQAVGDPVVKGLWGAKSGGVNILGGGNQAFPAQVSTTHIQLAAQPAGDMDEDDFLDAAVAANVHSRPRNHQFRVGTVKPMPKFF